MNKTTSFSAETYFAPITQPQAYRNIAYLLLSFPLGILYFVITVTGVALGASLSIIGIGLIILLILAVLLRGVATIEAELAQTLLGVRFQPASPAPMRREGWLGQLLCDSYTWRSLLFGLIKFPLGIISFVLTVVGLSVPLALASSAILYRFVPLNVGPGYTITTLNEALFMSVIGVLLAPIALALLNGWAAFCGLVVKVCLGAAEEPADHSPFGQRVLLEEVTILKSAESV